jgi:DNA-directed RNA polymerase subunit RPC12/RpoP
VKFIDNSQYESWNFCPWSWWEKYVHGYEYLYTGQRSDPLCLGSLVHNGLDNFVRIGQPVIDNETVEEVTPTPETMELATMLVNGYVQKYPAERWPVEKTEEPMVWPLVDLCVSLCEPVQNIRIENTQRICNDCDRPTETIYGLAKFDGYFYVPEDTTIESGLPGHTLTLQRGWWTREYKTKAAGRDRARWMQDWRTKMQADFQMLALRERVGEAPQGVLICVLEKPREYTPKRKCQGCGEQWELASFLPTGEGHACPMCGHKQKLSPYVPRVPKVPEFYRITAQRTARELEESERQIRQVALQMEEMRRTGLAGMPPDKTNCADNKYNKICEFYNPHTYGHDVADDAQFGKRDTTRYVGLAEIQPAA